MTPVPSFELALGGDWETAAILFAANVLLLMFDFIANLDHVFYRWPGQSIQLVENTSATAIAVIEIPGLFQPDAEAVQHSQSEDHEGQYTKPDR